tara:strand:+ start:548 stop:994 length:447 start_codon:yes stop_codon:yes gene_type:complete
MKFTTINKLDADNRVIKIDTRKTEDEAKARVAELHLMDDYEDAFYVDNDACDVNGQRPDRNCHHWIGDPVAKTVTLDVDGLMAEIGKMEMRTLRYDRNRALQDSDKLVNSDQWAVMTEDMKAKWTEYRQALRDLPSTALENIIWPKQP